MRLSSGLVVAAIVAVSVFSTPARAQWFKDRQARQVALENRSLYLQQKARIAKLEADVAQCQAEARKPRPKHVAAPVACDHDQLNIELEDLRKKHKLQLARFQKQINALAAEQREGRRQSLQIAELRKLLEDIRKDLPNIRSMNTAIEQLKMGLSITTENVNEILGDMSIALAGLKVFSKRLEKVETDISGLRKRVEKVEVQVVHLEKTKQDKLFLDISVGARIMWFKGESVENPMVELRLDFEVPSDGICSFMPGFSLAFAPSKDKAPANALRLMGKCGRRAFRFLFGFEELLVAKTVTGPGQFTWYTNPIIGLAIGGRWVEFTLLGSPSFRFREGNAAIGVHGFGGLVLRF